MNNVKYNYEVKLRPMGAYFFGGEMTFGNGANQHYFAKTLPYPQQTSIVGVLRYIGVTNPAGPLPIGNGFDAEKSFQHLGYIQQLSPLYFSESTGQRHFFSAFGHRGKPFNLAVLPSGIFVKKNAQAYFMPDFDPKKWYGQVLIDKRGTPTPLDKVVLQDLRVGITKSQGQGEQKDGFYKQRMATLERGWSFTCLAQLDNKAVSKLGLKRGNDKSITVIVPFGAEKGLFALTISRLDTELTFSDILPVKQYEHDLPKSLHAAVLLSDASVTEDAFASMDFSLAEKVPFRYIRTPSGLKNFAPFSRNVTGNVPTDRLSQSGKYFLLRRGSILYASSEEKLKSALTNDAFCTIGYNHYHLIKPQL